MLTAAQRTKCAKLAAALDSGDYATYKRAEDSLSPAMKGEVWSQRRHVRERAVKAGEVSRQSDAKPPRPARIETESRLDDLDFWASDEIEPPDDDDDAPDDQPTCSGCRGTGKGRDGGVCPICKGSGKVPAEDQPDDDREDDENE